MKSITLKIQDPSGMHARPAGEIVRIAKAFPGCRIMLGNDVKSVSALSILSILSLGLKQGATVTVSADGEGEDKALEEISAFVGSMQ